MTFIRYRLRLLLGLLAALALLTVGVASAAPGTGGAPAPTGGAAAAVEPLTCHLDGSRVEFTRGDGARAIAVAKAHCKDDRKAKIGLEVTLEESNGTKVGPKVRELCANDDTCVARTSAPRKRGMDYCVHAILFYSEPWGGEIKGDSLDACEPPPESARSRSATEQARPLTGAGLLPGVSGGGGG